MPGRLLPLVNNEIYHIVNRGVASQPLFTNQSNYQRILQTIFHYRIESPPRYSHLNRPKILHLASPNSKPLIQIIAYCLMPNHLHLLIKQLKDNGISIFMSNFTNSYVRYFNTKHKRRGPLFEGRFKAVRIETDEQLLHVSRYIHLNPYSSFIVKTIDQVLSYPYSSLGQYLTNQNSEIIDKKIILDFFKTPSSLTVSARRGEIAAYKEFVKDQADYQQKLDQIKHLTFET